jgi:hypothetical protein
MHDSSGELSEGLFSLGIERGAFEAENGFPGHMLRVIQLVLR